MLLPLLTCAVFAQARGSVTGATVVLVLVLWVVASAATGDRVAAVLAALSAGVWFDLLMTQPYGAFTIDDRDDVVTTVLLVVIGFLVTELALWGRRQQGTASRRAGYLDGMVGVAQAVADGDAPSSVVVGVVGRQIREVLGADGYRFVVGPVHDTRVAVLDHDGNVTRGGHPLDVDRVGLPTNDYAAVPVHRGHDVVGHFLVAATTRVTYPTREQRRVAVLLADQVATTLEHGATD